MQSALNARRAAWAGLMAVALCAAADGAGVEAGLADFREGRFAEALQDWRTASDAGDPRGALYVGVLFDAGQGVPQDYLQAMDWYRRAAESGSPAGAFNVGVLYDAGFGVSKDPREAAAWYSRAAGSGYGRAEYNLAMMYEAGTGVTRNRERAIGLFRRAASHGITAANTHLSSLGQPPVGGNAAGQQDKSMQDFQQAQQILLHRAPGEASRAAALFRQAADQHNPLAEYDLGYCYEHGLGVPRDTAQARSWYRRAVQDAKNDALRTMATSAVDGLDQIKRP